MMWFWFVIGLVNLGLAVFMICGLRLQGTDYALLTVLFVVGIGSLIAAKTARNFNKPFNGKHNVTS